MKLLNKIRAAMVFLKGYDYISLTKELLFFSKFFLLVIVYLTYDSIKTIGRIVAKIPFIGILLKPMKQSLYKVYRRVISVFNTNVQGEISSLDLVSLAVRHLKAKKNRTAITIGGMAIGFGAVIFLLSMGYGVQKLVVSRVARLGEMKQADVTTGQANSLVLDDEAIARFGEMKGVKSVLPFVSVVSKVTYNNSVSDAVAYGVTREFLEESAMQPSRGKIFEDGEILSVIPRAESEGVVAGVQTERISGAKMNKQYSEVEYSLYPLIWKAVYSEPSLQSEIIGYTRRDVGDQTAIEVWGNSYASSADLLEGVDFFGNEYSPWIKDDFPLWRKEACAATSYDCTDKEYILEKDGGLQRILSGYITEDDISLSRYQVFADSTPTLAEGEVVEKIQFSFSPDAKVPVYSEPENAAQRTSLFSGQETDDSLYSGELIFGEGYSDEAWGSAGENENGKELGYWIRSKLPLWRQLDCEDCEELFLKEVDSFEKQVEAYAYIPANKVIIEDLGVPKQMGQVLGEATASAEVASGSALLLSTDVSSPEASDESEPTEILLADGTMASATQLEDGTLDWVSISSDSAAAKIDQVEEIPFAENSRKEVLINRAMLNVLGITENDAVGKEFETSLLLDSEFFKSEGYQAVSELTKMTIIGVIPEDKTPAFYLPFSDIKNLGIENYSQVKVVVKDQNDLKGVREEIEVLGYRTSSVVDTVDQINSLFGTIRLLLSVLGLVALSVAALGMFNTLTVSLLEKTREVGLMKAIGMRSSEVKRLFLAESIIMGLSGGIFGLLLGVGAGYALSFALSSISVFKGLGYINLVSVPLFLALGILSLSFLVGVGTGLYPAHRATKISALNALRYE